MPGELLSVLVSISRGHNEIQTIEKNFQSETPGTKITFCRHSQSQKGNSAIIWKDCSLFGGILILSVKLIMHWETKFNQAMHE